MQKSSLYLTISAIMFVALMILIVILVVFRPNKSNNSDDPYDNPNGQSPHGQNITSSKRQQTNNRETAPIFETENDVNPPKEMPKELTTFGHECLYLHNYYRSFHRQTKNLTHSDSLTVSAQQKAEEMARTGVFAHTPGIKTGENLYYWSKSPGSKDDFDKYSCKRPSEVWYNEESKYNYDDPNPNNANGHFTQMVWKATIELGCAKGYSLRGRAISIYVVCHYSPPGNYIGEFKQNVLTRKGNPKLYLRANRRYTMTPISVDRINSMIGSIG